MNMQKRVSDEELEPTDTLSETFARENAGFSLVDFLRIIRVRWKLIAAAVVATTALAAAMIVLITPLYSATAIVMLDQQKNNVESADAILTGLGSDQATIQNQVQILTSLELAGRVVDKLKLDQDPEFNPTMGGWTSFLSYLNPYKWISGDSETQAAAQGQDITRDAISRRLLSRLSVDPIGLSTAMTITFQSEDPAKAAMIANSIANAYVEDQLEAKFDATQKATQWLSARIGELSRKAEEADEAVQRYKAAHNITSTGNGISVVEQQTSDINSQLVMSKTVLAEKQAAYSGLLSLARAGRAADSAAAMASPVIGALRSQESDIARQLADLSTKYLPGHPKILDLEAQKANIDAKISEEVQRIVDSARNDVSIAAAHVGSLQGSLASLENQGASQNQDAVQLTALQSAATSARSMYEAFLGKLNQTQGQEGILTPDSRIISNASTPTAPSFPKKGLTLGIAVPAGLILGLVLAFALERLDSGFRTTQQVEALLSLPVLSTVPELEGSAKEGREAADYVVEKPMSSFAEAIRGLQLGLSLANVDHQPKVIVVTSSVPGEGKTTVAMSLARIAARGGLKTIVVDGDLRRPNVAKSFGRDHFQNGLVEVLLGQLPLDQCLIKDTKSDVFVLPCLKAPATPSDMLSSQAMRLLVTNLSKAFDMVIIDSAPMLPVNDTKILSRMADAVLFVVRWEKTPREAAVNALRSLADVHAPVVGIALTRADSKRFRYYSYGYQNYYNYNKYYS
ncbi:MAG: polysaccharide biosynthesis tyrosine autokinase [Rhizomicrobium sp.]